VPSTAAGIRALTCVWLPSWPDSFAPQHDSTPFVSIAHASRPPAAIAVYWSVPPTRDRVGTVSAALSIPTSPSPFAPQHESASLPSIAHTVASPTATAFQPSSRDRARSAPTRRVAEQLAGHPCPQQYIRPPASAHATSTPVRDLIERGNRVLSRRRAPAT